MTLADIHELLHALLVGAAGILVMSSIVFLFVFYKLFEGDLWGSD